jgi:hypothetical protein
LVATEVDQATTVDDLAWVCLRCDHSFIAYPCRDCGSNRIEGGQGERERLNLTRYVLQ